MVPHALSLQTGVVSPTWPVWQGRAEQSREPCCWGQAWVALEKGKQFIFHSLLSPSSPCRRCQQRCELQKQFLQLSSLFLSISPSPQLVVCSSPCSYGSLSLGLCLNWWLRGEVDNILKTSSMANNCDAWALCFYLFIKNVLVFGYPRCHRWLVVTPLQAATLLCSYLL